MKQLTKKQENAIERAITILNNAGFIVEQPYDIDPTMISYAKIGTMHRKFKLTHYNGKIYFKILIEEELK